METQSFFIISQFWCWKSTGQIFAAICMTVLEQSNSKAKRCVILEKEIGKVKAAKSRFFFDKIRALNS